MDCTIKIIAGPEAGQEFTCAGPETYIGRSQRCAVRLASPAVSFEHAMISRVGDEFFVENLSANGTLLNNQRLTAKTRLKSRDQIQVTNDTVIRVERLPAVAGSGSASTRALLVVILIVMIFGGAGFLIWDPFAETTTYDWNHAYTKLQTMLEMEAADGQMPPGLPGKLQEAWRLEVAGDRTNARKAWLEMHVSLSDYEERTSQTSAATDYKSTLAGLLKKQKFAHPLTHDEFLAALHQFVVQMERRK